MSDARAATPASSARAPSLTSASSERSTISSSANRRGARCRRRLPPIGSARPLPNRASGCASRRSGTSPRPLFCPSRPISTRRSCTSGLRTPGSRKWPSARRARQPTSSPAMSSTAKIPIAMPKSVSARSTCCGVAPSSTRNWLSSMYGNITRLPTNPGPLPTGTPSFRSCFVSAMTLASTSRLVSRPRTISTSRITCAGLKKWRPTTDPGRDVASASSSMHSVDVFDARMQPGPAAASSSWKTCCLSARSSYTASMTRSADASASASAGGLAGRMRASRASTVSTVSRPRATDAS